MATLLEILPTADELLKLEPEELGGVLLELMPNMGDSTAGVAFGHIEQAVYPPYGPGGYDGAKHEQVRLALAEALSWLEVQGLVTKNPHQQAVWYLITRRGKKLRNKADLATYQLGRTLPIGLLQPELAEKVESLYLRGDYDTAVFQAFKTVEMAVRTNTPGVTGDQPAQNVMRTAFHPQTGALTDKTLVGSEQQAMSDLFAGAIGHAKNPPSHRDVNLTRVEAARLIVFASHLFEIVQWRALIG